MRNVRKTHSSLAFEENTSFTLQNTIFKTTARLVYVNKYMLKNTYSDLPVHTLWLWACLNASEKGVHNNNHVDRTMTTEHGLTSFADERLVVQAHRLSPCAVQVRLGKQQTAPMSKRVDGRVLPVSPGYLTVVVPVIVSQRVRSQSDPVVRLVASVGDRMQLN